jgi:orotate phosphoribosyltransferase
MQNQENNRLQSIIDLFFTEEIIKVDASSPFVLSSGAKAPIYLDHRRAFTSPKLRKLLVQAWAEELELKFKPLNIRPQNVVCVGTATAGIAPAMALAVHWDAPFLYVRQKPKGHGLQQMVEGAFDPGRPHLVVDDMLTTGQSLLKTVEILKQLDTRIVCATTVTSHGLKPAHRKFESLNLPCVSLLQTQQILSVAQDMGLISQADLRTVMSWIENLSTVSDSID